MAQAKDDGTKITRIELVDEITDLDFWGGRGLKPANSTAEKIVSYLERNGLLTGVSGLAAATTQPKPRSRSEAPPRDPYTLPNERGPFAIWRRPDRGGPWTKISEHDYSDYVAASARASSENDRSLHQWFEVFPKDVEPTPVAAMEYHNMCAVMSNGYPCAMPNELSHKEHFNVREADPHPHNPAGTAKY